MLLCKCAWTQPHIGDTNICKNRGSLGIYLLCLVSIYDMLESNLWEISLESEHEQLEKVTFQTALMPSAPCAPSTWARSKPPSGSVDPSIPITFEDLDTHSTTVPYISWHPWIESTQHTVILILYIYIIYMVKSCKIIQVIQDAQGGFLLPSVSLWELRVQCLRSSFGSFRRGASPGWVI